MRESENEARRRGDRAENIAAHIEEPGRGAMPPPSRAAVSLLNLAHQHLFNSIPNTILTLLCLWLMWETVPPFVSWAFLGATWTGTPDECRGGAGACWAVISEKHRLIFFGLYPYTQQWRPAAAMVLFVAAIALSAHPRMWGRKLIALWGVVLAGCGVLMWGGVLGLSYVPNERWGGLPLTLILAVVGIAAAVPLGILLALGRRSELPAIRALSVAYIELIRGVPLISVLFMASVMFPLFLPEGVSVDKLLRAQIGIILFTAAYIAEAVRAGLQAIPAGQYEAADALGLGYWKKTRLIILPQALRLVIPPLVNQFISTFKDTSLVIIIGLYDLLTTAKTAMTDPLWRPFYVETYFFTALIYFAFCYFMSVYSQYLERRLEARRR